MDLTTGIEHSLIGLAIGAVGWSVAYALAALQAENRRRTQAQLAHVERQIEELYGPLAALLYEGRQAFADLLAQLKRKHVFLSDQALSDNDFHTWLYWADTEFLPRNEEIRLLLRSKAHLIDAPSFPKSHVAFFQHCNSWAINHRRWKEQQIEYPWRSEIDWPVAFEDEVINSFQRLKAQHAELLGLLAPKKWLHRLFSPFFGRTLSSKPR